jgi:acylphosphatase
MLHDGLDGRITSDADGQVVVVVDGVPLGMEKVESLLRSHEGWSFSLQIVDSLE